MESSDGSPTPEEAAVALAEVEASRTMVARGVVLPPFFDAAIGAAITVQIATTALGLADIGRWAGWLLPAGVVVFVLVAGIELARFRRVNGVWLGGFAGRVVDGTAAAAATSYVLSLGAAGWAAFAQAWWLVAFCAAAGGMAYACSGRRWLRAYRAAPAAHGRGNRRRGWPCW
jgi:hypothetical protein